MIKGTDSSDIEKNGQPAVSKGDSRTYVIAVHEC